MALSAGHDPSDTAIGQHNPVITVKVLSSLQGVLHLPVDPIPVPGMDFQVQPVLVENENLFTIVVRRIQRP